MNMFQDLEQQKNIEKSIECAADASIPKIKNRKTCPMNIWWTDALIKLKVDRQKARRQWREDTVPE